MTFPLVEVPPSKRDPYLPLLRLADDSEVEVRRYKDTGTLYGLVDPLNGQPYGEVLVVPGETPQTAQLLSIAVSKDRQGQGVGRQLVKAVLQRLRDRGLERAMVGTASSSLAALAFYQKLGFRLLRVERDYFSPSRGYPPDLVEDGIAVRDIVWMDREL